MHETYILSFLNKAYTMESGIVQALQSMIKDEKDFAEFREPLENHLVETKEHVEMVKQRIKELGGNVSQTKKLSAQFMKTVKGWRRR